MKIMKTENMKEYMKEYSDNYKRTINGLVSIMYSSLRSNSKKRNMDMPNFTKKELLRFLEDSTSFSYMFSEWIESDCEKSIKPSIDRINDYLPYTLDNIQLITWAENKKKGHSDRKNGINNKRSTKVAQYSLDGIFIREYHSMMEAQRQTGILAGAIYLATKSFNKTSGGFRWKNA